MSWPIIEGVVIEGQKLGRTLGFPTANIALGDGEQPPWGVYATRTRLPDGRIAPGVANLGRNPTTGLVAARLEVHLFDIHEDLYGQTLRTQLVAFLRPELHLGDLDGLVRQMQIDALDARHVLQARAEKGSASAVNRLDL